MRLINRCKFTGLFSDLFIKPIKNIGLWGYVAYFSRNFAPEIEIFGYGYSKIERSCRDVGGQQHVGVDGSAGQVRHDRRGGQFAGDDRLARLRRDGSLLGLFFLPEARTCGSQGPDEALRSFASGHCLQSGKLYFRRRLVDASIITTSMPLIAMILAAIFLKEPITGRKILGIAVGASGALLLILGSSQAAAGSAPKGGNPVLGDLFVLLAQCSYAFYFVLFKNFVAKYSAVTVMKWMFTYAFICLLPFSYSSLLATDWLALDGARIASILFVVVGATFLSYILIIVGQKNLRPTVAGMYNYIQPLVATIVAICWGMDSFNLTKMLSVVMIFGGVWLVTSSKSRAEMEAYEAEKQAKNMNEK